MQPPQSLMGRNSFLSFCMVHQYVSAFTYVSVLIVLSNSRDRFRVHTHFITQQYYYYCYIVANTTCVVATSLAYEQDLNRDLFEIDLPLSIPFQHAAAAYTL